jgi:hypothetical protein
MDWVGHYGWRQTGGRPEGWEKLECGEVVEDRM